MSKTTLSGTRLTELRQEIDLKNDSLFKQAAVQTVEPAPTRRANRLFSLISLWLTPVTLRSGAIYSLKLINPRAFATCKGFGTGAREKKHFMLNGDRIQTNGNNHFIFYYDQENRIYTKRQLLKTKALNKFGYHSFLYIQSFHR